MKKLLSILALCAFATLAFAQDPAIKSAELKIYLGVPSNGTSEVQTITIGGTPTGGTFTLKPTGYRTTGSITWSATNATLLANIQAALTGLNSIGAGSVTVAAGTLTNGIGTVSITYGGALARSDAPDLTAASALTGTSPTVTVATTTPGVRATYRSATPGALLIDGVNGLLYVNQSTVLYAPAWTQK